MHFSLGYKAVGLVTVAVLTQILLLRILVTALCEYVLPAAQIENGPPFIFFIGAVALLAWTALVLFFCIFWLFFSLLALYTSLNDS